MSETMLEKAARALYEFGMMADCPKWDQLEQRYRQDFYDMARAVLMAVRSEVVADFDENCETVRVLDSVLSSEPTP